MLEWSLERWLLVPRDHRPVLYDVKTRKLEPFDIELGKGKKAASLQVLRTAKGTLLSMGTQLLRSTDVGKTWEEVAGFPAAVKGGDDAKGRFLTPLTDGAVVVTWGIGRQNQGFLLSMSSDDGKTWRAKSLHRVPDMPVTARFGAPRTVELKDGSLGTVFYNEKGLYFLRTSLDGLKERSVFSSFLLGWRPPWYFVAQEQKWPDRMAAGGRQSTRPVRMKVSSTFACRSELAACMLFPKSQCAAVLFSYCITRQPHCSRSSLPGCVFCNRRV